MTALKATEDRGERRTGPVRRKRGFFSRLVKTFAPYAFSLLLVCSYRRDKKDPVSEAGGENLQNRGACLAEEPRKRPRKKIDSLRNLKKERKKDDSSRGEALADSLQGALPN